jgi:hypothetical protein
VIVPTEGAEGVENISNKTTPNENTSLLIEIFS